MPAPFLPSPMTHGPGAPALDQEVTPLVSAKGSREPDPHNPLYKTDAEQSVAPFIARAMAKPLPDPRDYVVMPGGQTGYKTAEAAHKMSKREPFPEVQGSTSLDRDTFGTRIEQPPKASAALVFPPASESFGHDRGR